MNLGIIGIGYVGMTAAKAFAAAGHFCICYDEFQIKSALKNNLPVNVSIAENLTELVQKSEIIFICIGSGYDANANSITADIISNLVQQITGCLSQNITLVIKSTLKIGVCQKISSQIQSDLAKTNTAFQIDLIYNPEFLSQGSEYDDFKNPRRIIFGHNQNADITKLSSLYQTVVPINTPILKMDFASAEIAKLAANTFLAARVSLINEVAQICEENSAHIESVKAALSLDERIGPHFLNAGIGFGGSCFDKDIASLSLPGQNTERPLLNSIQLSNKLHQEKFLERIIKLCPPKKNRVYTLWGLSFKPGTDDLRNAPSLAILHGLLKHDVIIKCFDPLALSNLKSKFSLYPNVYSTVELASDKYSALIDSDCLIICTEWSEFLKPDFSSMLKKMKTPLIVDGRNLFNPSTMAEYGFEYFSVGRS